MKLSKKSEAMLVYNAYWDNYLKGDVEAMIPLLDDEYTQVGSAETEVFFNKKDAVQFLYDTIDQVAGKLEMRNRSTKLEQQENMILFHELCDVYVLTDKEWNFYSKFRASTLMQKKEMGWKITHQHSSMPDIRTEEGENIAIEKISKENLELRDAIKRRTIELEHKNRDLEIEASLERVRALAMGMRKPDDLQDICEVLFTELQALGFYELRNAMINIYNDDKSSFLNYDFSTNAGKTVIAMPYNFHPLIEKQVRITKSASDAFFEFSFSGKELKDFRELRKKNAELDDPKLEDTSSLHYYFYSIDTGSIGISTYSSITEVKLNLLKRFRNVFDFAYRRYMDVSQAEAQAREAKIEASLERVRSRSLAMHSSDELVDASSVLFNELKLLNIETIRTGIGIVDELNKTVEVWSSQLIKRKQNNILGVVPFNIHPFFIGYFESWKRKESYFSYEMVDVELKEYYKTVSPLLSYPEKKEFNSKELFYVFFFPEGSLNVITQNKLSEDDCRLMIRFALVFGLIYRRFLDLQQAEAQAREAQIQLGLERVRARTMAMQHSDELKDAAALLFQQMKALGVQTGSCGFNIWNKDEKAATVWMSSAEGGLQVPFKMSHTESAIYKNVYAAMKNGETFMVKEVGGKALEKHFDYLLSLPGIGDVIKHLRETGFTFPETMVYHFAFFNNGYLSFHLHEACPSAHYIFKRFAKAFEQTYTRFLDLQKAEAQAREAQIELALERVRARTMGMQKSEELKEVIQVVFDQFVHLNILIEHTGFIIDYKARDDMNIWLADQHEIPSQVTIPYFDCAHWNSFNEAKEKGMDFFINHLSFDEKNKFYQDLFKLIPGVPEETKEYYLNCPGLAISTVLLENVGLYIENFSAIPYTDEENNTLMRFGKVFQQTYTRFLDLQKAETQAREATIEAALEKVRGKAMAMHNSGDLSETASMVFTELLKLGIHPIRSGVGLLTKEHYRVLLYATTASSESHELSLAGEIEMSSHPYLKMQYESCTKMENYFPVLNGEELKSYYKELAAQISVPLLTEEQFKHEQYGYYFPFSEGYFYAWTEQTYIENEINILNRFKSIIELTFRRYLDLQKAESQAKESQIETALERVRSRTMAMYKSDELTETAAILFKQLSELGIAPNRLYIFIINDETGDFEAWITEEDGKKVSQRFKANIRQSPVFGKIYDGWKAQKKSITIDMQGKELTDYIQFLSEELHAPVTTGHSQKRRVQSVAYFSQGCIGIASPESQPDETINLLERFAGVFNLTYTRFNDLLMAEAQTHKANIEVALERVRARALAMQQPEELKEVAKVLRNEMGLLGVEELETCSIYINDENVHKAECWYALKDLRASENKLVSDHFSLDMNDTWVGREMLQFYNSSANQIAIEMKGTQRKEWIKYCEDLSVTLRGYYGEEIPERTYHLYKFSNGALGAASAGDISEESKDLLKRAASVFSLAYSRYKDLSKARTDLIQLKEEKKKSDALLLNILPVEIADELKKFGKSYARKHEQVTILFADIKGFSSIAENLSAEELVGQLDECFRAFDNIVEKHGLEKIKTIGDAYVCACGLPKPVPENAIKTILAGLDMIEFIKGFGLTKKIQNLPVFEFRVGIHTGPVITGVVGLKKFTYDIWGDAVNMAARMEQHGEAGKINISGFTYQLVKDKFTCIHRGKIEAKNKGEVDMYFVEKSL